jgi:Condensin II complex subunit CAP-H2 or CNDH2, N-terminal
MAPIDDAPGRLLQMLQPLRQLESNWSVDIAGELASYYEELSGLDFEVDGIAGLDFTDAALVVYHSSCTYSKKVEHLMKLTMSALESAKSKRKAKKGNIRDKKVSFSLLRFMYLVACVWECRINCAAFTG